MTEKKSEKEKPKGFWARLMQGLDAKMEAKAKSGGSCCCSGGSKDSKCS